MWTLAQYLPVAPFSLKATAATSSGGKTLLVMTPYALKMGLLDVAIRAYGVAQGEELFPLLRALTVRVAPPNDIIVLKSFSKIRRLVESKDSKKTGEAQEDFDARVREKLADRIEQKQYPFYSTIAYREYVYYRDAFQLALAAPDGAPLPSRVQALLPGLNYMGKRGGFIQLVAPPRQEEHLDELFIDLTPVAGEMQSFAIGGTLQMLDDCGPTLTFARANIYNAERVTLGKDRLLRHVVLPYRLARSSRGYTWYQRIDASKEEA